jgi:Phage integrase family
VRALSETAKHPVVQYAALERASIEDFRWHDLRHTWASWRAQIATPLFASQEMGSWESPAMVQCYAHLAADHLVPYAERQSALRAMQDSGNGTTWRRTRKRRGYLSVSPCNLMARLAGIEPTTPWFVARQ